MLSSAASRAVVLSDYQRRILDFVAAGKGHGVVQATAGAGKTSTLVEVAERLNPDTSACFLAFGRDAAAELARRLPPTIEAMTVHKLGRRTLARHLQEQGGSLGKVDSGKYRRLLRQYLRERQRRGELDAAGVVELEEYLSRLLDLARLNLTDIDDPRSLEELAGRYSVAPPPPELPATGRESLRQVLLEGEREGLSRGLVDFTDMLYLPVQRDLQPPRFDFVCVDEAQDYSSLALAFTMRLVDEERGGRLLFVGDPRQSIFGFAGADSEAIARIVRETSATVLPLSITYRCPRSHVSLAKLIAPEIEAGPAASEGSVYWISDEVLRYWAREGDMVLCRANAPLVRTCLRLVASGRRAFVRGRNLPGQLGELARRALARPSPAGAIRAGRAQPGVMVTLEAFARAEEDRLRRRLAGVPHREAILAERRDLLACLLLLAGDLPDGASLPALLERIEGTFGETEDAVILSTIHRAKGQEAERVLILYPELMPAPYARTVSSLHGETCVQFVALTRAKRDLVFVTDSSLPANDGLTGGRPSAHYRRYPPGEVLSEVADGDGTTEPDEWLTSDDLVGQGQGVWREVLIRARLLARGRG